MDASPETSDFFELSTGRTAVLYPACSLGDESETLWRLYCKDDKSCTKDASCTKEEAIAGVGVALQTTLGKLEASVEPHDLYVSPIIYRHYHEGEAFNDERDPFMHKRRGFTAEKELRLLRFDQTHYSSLVPPDSTVTDLDKHLFLDWSAADTIEGIFLSPYTDEVYETRVRDEIGKIDSNLLSRVQLSVLHERRYAAQF